MATIQSRATVSALRRHRPFSIGWLVSWLVVAVGPAAAQTEPATAPSEEPKVTVSLPAALPARTRTVAGRIVLTPVEKTILGAVQDRTRRFDETGLYVMFAVAARAPELGAMQWYELDRPAYVNLLADPARYRAAPLRAKVRIYYVSKRTSGAGLGFRRFWPKDRPVWEMDCLWTDEPHERDKPVRVYSVVDPGPLIGDPDEIGPHNRHKYSRGPIIRIAALSYKVLRDLQESNRQERDYPVLIAWQLSRTVPWKSVGKWDVGALKEFAPLLFLVIVLGAGFYFTRRRLAKLKQADRDAARRRRPLSYQTDEEAAASAPMVGRDEPHEVPDGSVDPKLAAAVEEFLQEKERADDDGGKDHSG